MATLIVVSVIAEGALLFVHVADHNLLWWLGIFSAGYAGACALIPDETKAQEDPEELAARLGSHTHYTPPHWNHRCHTTLVRDEIAALFPYKIQVFAMEVLSVVLTPIVLCFSMPNCAPAIIDFVRCVGEKGGGRERERILLTEGYFLL